MTLVMTVISVTVGHGGDQARLPRDSTGPESIRILARLTRADMSGPDPAARKRPAEGRISHGQRLVPITHGDL